MIVSRAEQTDDGYHQQKIERYQLITQVTKLHGGGVSTQIVSKPCGYDITICFQIESNGSRKILPQNARNLLAEEEDAIACVAPAPVIEELCPSGEVEQGALHHVVCPHPCRPKRIVIMVMRVVRYVAQGALPIQIISNDK